MPNHQCVMVSVLDVDFTAAVIAATVIVATTIIVAVIEEANAEVITKWRVKMEIATVITEIKAEVEEFIT